MNSTDMASKSLLLFSLLLATFLLAASARDLAEKTEEKSTKEGGFGDEKYPYGGGYGGYPGGGYGGYPGGGYGGYPGGGYGRGGYGGGYCRFGCCRRGYYGGCRYCCPYPGAETEGEPGN